MQERIALVTGGTGALGRSVVRRLVEEGARVHSTWISPRDDAELDRIFGDAAAHVTMHQADVTSPQTVDALFKQIKEAEGRLDILCNIAGGFVWAPLAETSPATWRKMIDMNATSAFLCSRAAAPHLRQSGRGRIVNVASGPALDRGAANMSAYAASKAAVLNLTYSLSKELAAGRITVNAIVPSIIDTPDNRKAMPDADTSTWVQADEIAEVVAWLVSDAAGIVTGTAVNLARG
jgi:NAD(P)-dependent dehydrogenase (short-subunit alcohol dehydrogenase family)